MIPRLPTEAEMGRARMTSRMVRDGWSFVHPDDIAEAEDIMRRRLWWDTAAGIAGAVVVALVLAAIATAAWS